MNQFDRLERLARWIIEGPFHHLWQRGENGHLLTPDKRKQTAKMRSATEEMPVLNGARLARRWALDIGHRTLPLGEPVVRLGCAPDNDIVLSDPSIGLYHAQLRWRDGGYHLYPAIRPARKNGSRPAGGPHGGALDITLNHQPVFEARRLAPGDVIRLGSTILRVIIAPVES